MMPGGRKQVIWEFAAFRTRTSRTTGETYDQIQGHTRRTPKKAEIAARKRPYRRPKKDITTREDLAFHRMIRERYDRAMVVTPGQIRRLREWRDKMKEETNAQPQS